MTINKTQVAKDTTVHRRTLYYQPILPAKDEALKQLILETWKDKTYAAYGHKRLALHLQVNKKRLLRVMNKFKLHPPRRRVQKPVKPEDIGNPEVTLPNLLWNKDTKQFVEVTRPNQAWAEDFTYLWFMGRFWYLATVIEVYTKEILGFAISDTHDTSLVLAALKHALHYTGRIPDILHSDQGSEYTSKAYQLFVTGLDIKLSYSRKSSPWQNGFQESYYNNFKLDLGHLGQFKSPGQLAEGIYQTIYCYNNKRMHTTIKMTPKQFYEKYQLTNINADVLSGKSV
jgi:putative transposase